MEKTLLKLAYMLLKNRKSFVVAIIGLISLSTILTNFAITSSNSIYKQKMNLAKQIYGSFISGINEITEEDVNKIKANKNIRSGFYELYANAVLDGLIFTIGYGEEAFIDMVNINLQTGKMPAKDDEIAVEQFVADMYGFSALGTEIDLVIEGKSKRVKVVGIINNYSNQLDVNYQLQKGVNNYPNILCCEKSNFIRGDAEEVKTVLLNFNNDMDFSSSYDTERIKMIQEIESMGISLDNSYNNDSFFNRGLAYCQEIRLLCLCFAGIIIFATLFCCIMLLRIFYKDYAEKIGVFITCGLQKNKVLHVIAIQLIIILIVSGCVSLLGSSMICKYLITHLFPVISDTMLDLNFLSIGIWYLILCLLLLIIYLHIFYKVQNVSTYQGLLKDNLNRLKVSKRYKMNYNIKTGMSSPKPGVIFLFFGLFCACFLSLYSYGLFYDDYAWQPDYELYSKYVTERERINGYEIEYNPDSYISKDAVNKLEEFKEDIFIDLVPFVNSNTLLLEKGNISAYFDQWCKLYVSEDTDVEESAVKKNWPTEADEMFPVPNVDYIIADEAMLNQIITIYDLDVDIERLLNNSTVLLFLPESDSGENIGLEEGDTITLGGVSLYDQEVDFESCNMTVEAIIQKAYRLSNNDFTQERGGITIVVSKDLAEKEPFFIGYQSIKIEYASDLDTDTKLKIDNCVHQIKSEVQGGVLYSKASSIEAAESFTIYSRSLAVSLMVVIIIFCIIIVYTQLYSLVIEKEKEYAILRSMGASIEWISENIYMSYLKSMLLSFGLDSLIVLFCINGYLSISQYIIYIIISALIVYLVFYISKILPNRTINKMSITSSLKNGHFCQNLF